jgi:hypothetical protein
VTVKIGKRVLGTGQVVGGRAVVRLWAVKRAATVRARLVYTGDDVVAGDKGYATLVVRR